MDLVQLLMAFVIAYLEGSYPIKDLEGVLVPANRRKCTAWIPELKDALAAYDRGDEIDWLELAAGVSAYAETYAKEPGAKASFLQYLRTFATYYKSSSDNALKALSKLSGLLEDDYIQGYFSTEDIDQAPVRQDLATLVKKLGGTGIGLTLEQSKDAKERDPARYKQYLDLRRQFTLAWKSAIGNFVRSTGNITVPLADVLKHLKSKGIEHGMPTGFTGRIDAHGNWYTIYGDKIDGGAPSVVMFPTVRMNPAFSPESPWVFQAMRTDGTAGNYFYTTEYKKQAAEEKFAAVASFDPEKARKRWLPLIKAFKPNDPKPECVAALILEILYQTSNRIGTSMNKTSPKEGGFGICTLMVGHFYPQPDGSVRFIYLGKDSVKTVANIKKTDSPVHRLVCDAVNALAEGKKPREPLFTYALKNNTYRPIQPGFVNRLFRQCAGSQDLTVHKLRTARGTAMFQEYINTLFEKKKKLDAKGVMEQWKKAGEVVGKQLNHVRRSAEGTASVQPMTSLKNYIDPSMQVQLFQHYGVPIPTYLEKILGQQALASVQDDAQFSVRSETVPAPEDQVNDPLLEEVLTEGPEILQAATRGVIGGPQDNSKYKATVLFDPPQIRTDSHPDGLSRTEFFNIVNEQASWAAHNAPPVPEDPATKGWFLHHAGEIDPSSRIYGRVEEGPFKGELFVVRLLIGKPKPKKGDKVTITIDPTYGRVKLV